MKCYDLMEMSETYMKNAHVENECIRMSSTKLRVVGVYVEYYTGMESM